MGEPQAPADLPGLAVGGFHLHGPGLLDARLLDRRAWAFVANRPSDPVGRSQAGMRTGSGSDCARVAGRQRTAMNTRGRKAAVVTVDSVSVPVAR